jgi:2-aminoethylphosphonate-pyruvate transaminase
LAFRQALIELREEGGVDARNRRYRENCDTLIRGMDELGFSCLIEREVRSPIITAFAEPDHPGFHFESFYERLAERQCIIYPGKLSRAASFRIGTIGKLDSSDVSSLLDAIRETLDEMNVIL